MFIPLRYVLGILLLLCLQTEVLYARRTEGVWGKWSKWSNCSVPCGTGIYQRHRICEHPYRRSMAAFISRVDNSLICEGPKKEIFVCNTQVCSDSMKNVREEQCSGYNHKIFSGKNYVWKPFINPTAPCELTCRPDGQSFYARLSERVSDGTSCGIKKQAVCIRGQCVDVGCDGAVGSPASVDKCGVCKGDNSTCRTISGIYTRHEVPVGYNKIIDIPIGSTNINISELKPSTNYLVLKSQDGSYIINGNYEISSSGEYETAGTVIQYTKRSQKCRGECIFVSGPTTYNIQLQVLAYHKNPGIIYSFNVPVNVTDPYLKKIVDRQNTRKLDNTDGLSSEQNSNKQSREQKTNINSHSDQRSDESDEIDEPNLDVKSLGELDTVEILANYKNSIMDANQAKPLDISSLKIVGDDVDDEIELETTKSVARNNDKHIQIKEAPVAVRPYDKSSLTINYNNHFGKPQHDSAHTASRSFSRLRLKRPLFSQSFTFRDRFRLRSNIRRKKNRINAHQRHRTVNIHNTRRLGHPHSTSYSNIRNSETLPGRYKQQRQGYYNRNRVLSTSAPRSRYYPTAAPSLYPTSRPNRGYYDRTAVPREHLETSSSRRQHEQVTYVPRRRDQITSYPRSHVDSTRSPRIHVASTPTPQVYTEAPRRSRPTLASGLKTLSPSDRRVNINAVVGRSTIPARREQTSRPTERPVVVEYRTKAPLPTDATDDIHQPTEKRVDNIKADINKKSAVVTLGANSQYKTMFEFLRNKSHIVVNSQFSKEKFTLKADEDEKYTDSVDDNEDADDGSQVEKRIVEELKDTSDSDKHSNYDTTITLKEGSESNDDDDDDYTDGDYTDDNEDSDYGDKVEQYDENGQFYGEDVETKKGVNLPYSGAAGDGSNHGIFDQAIDPLQQGQRYDQQYLQTDNVLMEGLNPNLRRPIIQPAPPRYSSVIPRHSAYSGTGGHAALTGGQSYSRNIVPNRIDQPLTIPAINLPRHENEILGSLYVWKISGFSACTTSCGGGVQQTVVVCLDTGTQAVVTDQNCNLVERPSAKAATCNSRPCPARWDATSWSPCSTTCGPGIQSRTVVCVSRVSPTLNLTMPNDRCLHEVKPDTKQTCEVDACFTWKTGNWSMCSRNCGEGRRTRDVRCINYNGHTVSDERCSQIKPTQEEQCDSGSCGKGWFYTEWPEECPSSCGYGSLKRKLHCAGIDGTALQENRCDRSSKPEDTKSCRTDIPCGGEWFIGNWMKCNATCGPAVKSREIVCIKKLSDSIMAVVNEVNCDKMDKPLLIESCDLPSCQPLWYMSDWAKCSTPCGTGVRSREVKCLDENQSASADCDPSQKPRTRDKCNTRGCSQRNAPSSTHKNTGSDESCKDSFSRCSLVTKTRLCQYSYYKKMCCFSCKDAS